MSTITVNPSYINFDYNKSEVVASSTYFSNKNNAIDIYSSLNSSNYLQPNINTNATGCLWSKDEYIRFWVHGFDFSYKEITINGVKHYYGLPPKAVINNITLKVDCATDPRMQLYLYATRKVNLSTNSLITDIALPKKVLVDVNQSRNTFSTSSTTDLGTWTKTDLLSTTEGIGFYFLIKRTNTSVVTNRYIYIYNISLEINYDEFFDIGVISNDLTKGKVTGTGTFKKGTDQQIEAIPEPGYVFTNWSDGSAVAKRTIYVSQDKIYTAFFENKQIKINFNSCGGDIHTNEITAPYLSELTNLPIPTRAGYTFTGWYPFSPVLNSGFFKNNDFRLISSSYKFTDKISIHLSIYLYDWNTVIGKQFISCSQEGGWDIGHYADATPGRGAEFYFKIPGNEGYKGVDFNLQNLSSGWHDFDIVFTGTEVQGYVDNELVDTKYIGNYPIYYKYSNPIYIGAEAGIDTTPEGGHFLNSGFSSIFIENIDYKIEPISENSIVTNTENYTLYAGWKINYYTTLVTAYPGNSGTVNGTLNLISFNPYGDTLELKAIPEKRCRFIQWSLEDNTSPILNLTINQSRVIIAYFESVTKIFIGNTLLKDAYVGTTPVKAIYKGTTQIF